MAYEVCAAIATPGSIFRLLRSYIHKQILFELILFQRADLAPYRT